MKVILKNAIHLALFISLRYSPFRKISSIVLMAVSIFFRSVKYCILRIGVYSEYKSVMTIYPEEVSTIKSPNTIDCESPTILEEYPSVHARIIRGATINERSDALICKNGVYIPDYTHANLDRFRLSSENIKAHNDLYALTITKNINNLPIDCGIKVFGNGSFNWYHWLLEILPAAFAARCLTAEFANWPYLVPSGCDPSSTFMASLRMIDSNRSTITLREDYDYLIDKLVIFDSITSGPYNLIRDNWPRRSDVRQNDRALMEMRDHIVGRIEAHKEDTPKRIFLYRKNGRRNYNQEEISELCKRYGFSCVSPEDYSFEMQVALFHYAEYIIGTIWCGLGQYAFFKIQLQINNILFSRISIICRLQ